MFKEEARQDGFFDFFKSRISDDKNVLNSTVRLRINFLKKVYGILSIQLLSTFLIGSTIASSDSLSRSVLSSPWLSILSALGAIGISIALCFKRKEYPTNFILLGIFTFLESITLGAMVSMFDPAVVLTALGLTVCITVGLTLYVFLTKTDFSYLNASIFTLMSIILAGGLIQIFLRNAFVDLAISCLGVYVFSLYIIYDTHEIMKRVDPEEYIFAVINLYLDIINLFIKLLKVLQHLQQKKEDNKKRRN